MIIFASLALLSAASAPVEQAAMETSRPIKEGLSESARSGELRVLQLWSTDSERFLKEWAQPTPPNLTIDSRVQRNKPIEQFIIFGGCQADAAGNCNLSGETTMIDPAGEVYGETMTFKAWDNLPKPKGHVLSLSPMGTGLIVEDGERLGTYRIRLSITDNVAKVTATTEVGILVEEAAPEPDEDAVRIRIDGFQCGDNCYLDYSVIAPAADADPAGESQSALCNVDACYPWFDFQEMPPEFIGRTAIATIGIGEQYDNEGNVMSDDFPQILSITLDPVE